VFTQHIPRTGNPVGKSHSVFTRVGAGIGTIALAAGVSLMAAPAASADTVAHSYAEGQFLSGTIAGTDLANVAALESAWASNNGSEGTKTSKDPLNAEVLQTINVQSPNGVQLDLGSYVDAGAVNQYARANADGSSMAASGAIGDDGAIGAGAVGTGPAGDLSVDLDSLLNPSFASAISDLRLSLEAVSAQATADLSNASGDYTIAGATLSLTSPAISGLTAKVTQALASVDSNLLALGSDDGALGNAVDGVLDPVLGAIGSSANVSVTVDSDVQAAVQDLLNGSYGNGAVSFNLQTGAVEVDLATLLGGELNDLAPNTEILNDKVINQVLKGITDTVATLADQIVDRVKAALHNATVHLHADLNLLTAQDDPADSDPVTDTPAAPVAPLVVDIPVVTDLVDELLGGDAAGGLDGLLDLPGVTQLSDLEDVLDATQISQLTDALGISDLTELDGLDDVQGVVDQLTGGLSNGLSGLGGGLSGLFGRTLSALPPHASGVAKALPGLESTVTVDIEGNVDDLMSGTAARADASVSLLGGTVNAAIDAQTVVDALSAPLQDGLFGEDGTVQSLVNALNSGLVDPAVTGLLGNSSVSTVLNNLVSVKANVQELTPAQTGEGSQFTQTALRISVLPNASTQLATLNVAAATVGPNITTVVPPCTTNCGPNPPCVTNCGPNPPCVTNCGPPAPQCTTGCSATDRLAYTGVGVATLIAVILALLAAGAYLAREGYRRNHTKSLTSD
jgi:hypothetical protein